jgi:Uma2 family endonuclease
MRVEVYGRLPAVITLDDLAAMNDADQHGHRFELSPEGALSVMPLADSEHAVIASKLITWLVLADHVLQAAGIRIPGPDGSGGRIPDLTVWAGPRPSGVWQPVAGLVLVVEIVTPSSAATDRMIKPREYAQAGIPRYWLIDRDVAQTVTLHLLGADRTYQVAAKVPLAWLLQTAPADHLGG